MSKFDDEIDALENELSKQEAPKGNNGVLFPMLLKNSKIEQEKLAKIIKDEQAKLNPITIPDKDERTSQQSAEEALVTPQGNEKYRELLALCGFCGICDSCKMHIYNQYKEDIRNYPLAAIEERITMHQKACVAAIERERASRDTWEEKLKEATEEEKALRITEDMKYVPLTRENKKRTVAAKSIADKNKPAKRMSQDSRMAQGIQKLFGGVDMATLMGNFGKAVADMKAKEKK